MSANDKPWICPSCAHFIVRRPDCVETPTHRCHSGADEVDFIPYVDSDQALQIRSDVERSFNPTNSPRSIR